MRSSQVELDASVLHDFLGGNAAPVHALGKPNERGLQFCAIAAYPDGLLRADPKQRRARAA